MLTVNQNPLPNIPLWKVRSNEKRRKTFNECSIKSNTSHSGNLKSNQVSFIGLVSSEGYCKRPRGVVCNTVRTRTRCKLKTKNNTNNRKDKYPEHWTSRLLREKKIYFSQIFGATSGDVRRCTGVPDRKFVKTKSFFLTQLRLSVFLLRIQYLPFYTCCFLRPFACFYSSPNKITDAHYFEQIPRLGLRSLIRHRLCGDILVVYRIR